MEIVGTVAASTELVKQCASLIGFIRRVKVQMRDGPSSIQIQIQRLERLETLVFCIKQNPSLQGKNETPVLTSYLESCLRYATDLEICLQGNLVLPEDGRRKKIEKAIRCVRAEAKIESLLSKIDRERGNLMLSIQNIDASLLQDVHTSTKDMKCAVDDLASDLKDVKSMINSHINHVSNSVNGPKITDQRYLIIPNRRVSPLLGREDILTKIEESLSSGPGPRIVVLRGLGGQGKTQVALEYCHRAKNNEVQSIFWIDATSAGTVKKDFAVIYEHVKGIHNATRDSEKVRFVLEVLERWNYPWLAVFDNHDNPASFHLPDYIPSGENARIIITSRHADTGQLAEQDFDIELPGLSKDNALDLLVRHSRAKDPGWRVDGYAIVDRLGYHALAIVQAGSYIQTQKIKLSQFMEIYNYQREAVLRQTPKMSPYRRKLGDAEDETALNVFTTWELSFQQLETHDNEKKSKSSILTLFAFLDRQKISHHLFEIYCGRKQIPDSDDRNIGRRLSILLHDGKWDKGKFIDLLNDLSQLSLIHTWCRDSDDSCHLSLHPLVRDWIRLRIAPSLCYDYTVASMDILYEVIKNSYSASRHTYHMALPLRQEIQRHLAVYEENRGLLAGFGLKTDDSSVHGHYEYLFAGFYYYFDLYENASVISERVSKWYLAKYGADNSHYNNSRGLFSNSLACMGYSKRAQEIGQDTYDSLSKSFGPEYEDTLIAMDNLAVSMYSNGYLTEARKLCKQAIVIKERVHGPNHRRTLLTTALLATIASKEGDWAASEKGLRALLSADAHNMAGQHDSFTLRENFQLAVVLCRQHKYVEALGFIEMAYAAHFDIFGPDHEQTLQCRSLYWKTLKDVELLKEDEEKKEQQAITRGEPVDSEISSPSGESAATSGSEVLDNTKETTPDSRLAPKSVEDLPTSDSATVLHPNTNPDTEVKPENAIRNELRCSRTLRLMPLQF